MLFAPARLPLSKQASASLRSSSQAATATTRKRGRAPPGKQYVYRYNTRQVQRSSAMASPAARSSSGLRAVHRTPLSQSNESMPMSTLVTADPRYEVISSSARFKVLLRELSREERRRDVARRSKGVKMKIEYAPAETSSANRASSNGGGDDGRVGGGKLLSFREVFELMKNIDPASLPLSHDQKQHRDDSPAGRNSAATETVPQSLEFGLLLHSAFRDSQYIPYTAFYAESPPLNHTSLLSPFEMVFIDAPALRGITADSSPFRSFLHAIQPSESNKVAVFPNLGSNALLIAPAYNNHPDFRTNAAGAAGEGYFKLLRTIHLQQPALESMSGDDDSNGDGGDDGDDGGDDDVSRVNDRVTGGAHREGYYKKTDPNRYAHYASFIRQAPLKQVFALWREIGQQVLTIYPSKTASYAHRDVSSNISRDRKDDNDDVGNDDSGDDGGGGDMATATHFHQQYRHGGGNLWCSTSGLGVYWLHIRLDQYPKYYTYRPYKQVKEW